MPTNNKSLEDSANDAMKSLRSALDSGRVTAEDKVRESPMAALAGAAAIGYLFRLGIIGSLLGVVFRLVTILAQPLLIGAAIWKLMNMMQESEKSSGDVSNIKSASTSKPRVISSPLEAAPLENPVLT
jgi:predicted lipid-binding transport protein (Tim44 family)